MKRPLWFRRRNLSWTPCTWQGWLIVAAFTGFISFIAVRYAPTSVNLVIAATLLATALVIGVAVYTDDTHQRLD